MEIVTDSCYNEILHQNSFTGSSSRDLQGKTEINQSDHDGIYNCLNTPRSLKWVKILKKYSENIQQKMLSSSSLSHYIVPPTPSLSSKSCSRISPIEAQEYCSSEQNGHYLDTHLSDGQKKRRRGRPKNLKDNSHIGYDIPDNLFIKAKQTNRKETVNGSTEVPSVVPEEFQNSIGTKFTPDFSFSHQFNKDRPAVSQPLTSTIEGHQNTCQYIPIGSTSSKVRNDINISTSTSANTVKNNFKRKVPKMIVRDSYKKINKSRLKAQVNSKENNTMVRNSLKSIDSPSLNEFLPKKLSKTPTADSFLSDEILQSYIACEIQNQYLSKGNALYMESNNNFPWKERTSNKKGDITNENTPNPGTSNVVKDAVLAGSSLPNDFLHYHKNWKDLGLFNYEETQAINYERYCEVFQKLYHEQLTSVNSEHTSLEINENQNISKSANKKRSENGIFLHPRDVDAFPISSSKQKSDSKGRKTDIVYKKVSSKSEKRKLNDQSSDASPEKCRSKKQCTVTTDHLTIDPSMPCKDGKISSAVCQIITKEGTVDITAGSSSASQPANGVVCSTSIVTHNDNEQLQTTIEYPSKHSPFNSSVSSGVGDSIVSGVSFKETLKWQRDNHITNGDIDQNSGKCTSNTLSSEVPSSNGLSCLEKSNNSAQYCEPTTACKSINKEYPEIHEKMNGDENIAFNSQSNCSMLAIGANAPAVNDKITEKTSSNGITNAISTEKSTELTDFPSSDVSFCETDGIVPCVLNTNKEQEEARHNLMNKINIIRLLASLSTDSMVDTKHEAGINELSDDSSTINDGIAKYCYPSLDQSDHVEGELEQSISFSQKPILRIPDPKTILKSDKCAKSEDSSCDASLITVIQQKLVSDDTVSGSGTCMETSKNDESSWSEIATNIPSAVEDSLVDSKPSSVHTDDLFEKDNGRDELEERFKELELTKEEENEVENVEWSMWMERLKGTDIELMPTEGTSKYPDKCDTDFDDIDVILLNVREQITLNNESKNIISDDTQLPTLNCSNDVGCLENMEDHSKDDEVEETTAMAMFEALSQRGFLISPVNEHEDTDLEHPSGEETNDISITAIKSPHTIPKEELIVSTLGWSESDANQPVSSARMLHWSYCRMTNHLLDPTRESFKCPLCEYKSPRKGHVERHILIHSGEKPYTCSECNYKSHTKDAMTLHARVHSGFKKFVCNRCSYATNRKIYLERHLALHDQDRIRPCAVCVYKATKVRLVGKLKEAASEDLERDSFHETEASTNGVECDSDADSDYGRIQLVKTESDYNNEYSVADSVFGDIKVKEEFDDISSEDLPRCTCQFSSTSKSVEKSSMRKVKVYSEDRPYPCSLCSYRATKKSLLDKHMKVHTGERPFPCPLCKYRASRKAHLLRHMRTHQKELE